MIPDSMHLVFQTKAGVLWAEGGFVNCLLPLVGLHPSSSMVVFHSQPHIQNPKSLNRPLHIVLVPLIHWLALLIIRCVMNEQELHLLVSLYGNNSPLVWYNLTFFDLIILFLSLTRGRLHLYYDLFPTNHCASGNVCVQSCPIHHYVDYDCFFFCRDLMQ